MEPSAPADPYECEEGQAHYWLIVTPNGPTSSGHCSNCGVDRDFVNSLDAGPAWRKSHSLAQGAAAPKTRGLRGSRTSPQERVA